MNVVLLAVLEEVTSKKGSRGDDDDEEEFDLEKEAEKYVLLRLLLDFCGEFG